MYEYYSRKYQEEFQMKKLTRILCLVLCLVMLVPMIVACSEKDSSYGAQINMYLTNEVYNLDPAYAHLDRSALKLCGLLFEGLMTIDEDGDLEEALVDDWDYVEDEHIKEDPTDDTFTMTIELEDSAWSDGRAVHADQFVFAWKRLLDPDFYGEGAELLYDIKGAYDRKVNMASPDDIGLTADKKILTIEFAHSVDPEEFLRKTASIALAPLREDAVKGYKDWSSANTTIVTNGPFTLLSYEPGQSMQLARSPYYRRDISNDDYVDPTKYVNPYLINIDFQLNAEEMMKAYNDGELFYISELPCDKATRDKYKKKAEISNTLCTHMYYFNTNKAPFNVPEVRKALSDVINRNDLVSEVVFAYAATGIVPNGISDAKSGSDFAKNNQNKLSAEATKTTSQAKQAIEAALSANGMSTDLASYGKIYLTVKTDVESGYKSGSKDELEISTEKFGETVDLVVAKKVAALWKQIGLDVEVKCVNTEQYKESTTAITQRKDMLVNILYGTYGNYKYWNEDDVNVPNVGESWDRGDAMNADDGRAEGLTFDVIAIDYQMLIDEAFSALSVFATDYSGSTLSTTVGEEIPLGHVTGYKSERVDTLIAEAYAAKSARAKGYKNVVSEKLHEVEKILLEEMPVIPLFVYKDAVLINDDLSDIEYNYFGGPNFNDASLKDWQDYIEEPEKDDKDDKKKR